MAHLAPSNVSQIRLSGWLFVHFGQNFDLSFTKTTHLGEGLKTVDFGEIIKLIVHTVSVQNRTPWAVNFGSKKAIPAIFDAQKRSYSATSRKRSYFGQALNHSFAMHKL